MTITLNEREVCPRKDFCLFSKECKGIDPERNNKFVCHLPEDDPIKEEPRREPINLAAFKVPLCKIGSHY
jgi:hypothetical protein